MAGSLGSQTGRQHKEGGRTADRRASASAANLRDVGRNESGQDPSGVPGIMIATCVQGNFNGEH